MHIKSFLSGLMILGLAACGPANVMREQEHFGLKNWIAGAATAGHLDLVLYHFDDANERKLVRDAMNGHNYGPVVDLRLSKDHEKGARVVVVKDPGFNVYRDHLCAIPKGGLQREQTGRLRVAMAICYNDWAYGNVNATARNPDIKPGDEEYERFFATVFRQLSDPSVEEQEARGGCGNTTPC